MKHKSFEIIEYQKEYEPQLISFLERCLPESHRCLDINGRHSYYMNIAEHFVGFRCMFDGSNIIGTVAVSELESQGCELKSLYLLEKYQGMGYGKEMLIYAINQAKKLAIRKCFLILCLQVQKQLLYIAESGSMILKSIIQVYIQMCLWF